MVIANLRDLLGITYNFNDELQAKHGWLSTMEFLKLILMPQLLVILWILNNSLEDFISNNLCEGNSSAYWCLHG